MTSTLQPAILAADLTAEAGPLFMGKPLDTYRMERYMTQREFAELLGITQRAYIQIVKGRSRPRLTTMRRIAEKLGVHPSDIAEFELPLG